MKCLQYVLPVAIVLVFAAAATGKAAFKSKTQMIESSDAIAVVDITATDKVSIKGKHWTYAQKATAKVEQTLKGKLPETISLYGDEDFICARCHFEIGKYLVFLNRDGDNLVGNNWQPSARKITADKVEGFNDEDVHTRPEASLADVLREIPIVLSNAKPAEKKSE